MNKQNNNLVWLGKSGFLAALILFSNDLPLKAQSSLDAIVFGNTSSETAHSFVGPNTAVITNASISPAQTARRGLTNNPVTIYGGSLTFKLAIDSVRRNYFTVKLWGSDEPVGSLVQDADMGRLYLYVAATNFYSGANPTNFYQVGYRHEGDYDPLNAAGYKPPVAGRFFYSTTLLPLWMTQGRTNLTLTIQPGGRVYDLGSGGPPSGTYQFNMFTNSRGIYQAYTHTEPVLNPIGEVQGSAPATTTRPTSGSTSGVATMSSGGTYWNKINSAFNGLLTKNTTNFTTEDVRNLAVGYWITNFPNVYTNPAVVMQVTLALDYCASNYYADPTGSVSAGGNEGWGGRFGYLGWAIDVLLPKLTNVLDTTTNYGTGGNVTRRQAWGDMLLASRDYGRFNRDAQNLSNQSLIANQAIYWANRGLLDLTNANAFAETNGQRYLREAIGSEPWLGSDLTNSGSSYSLGTNYYMITSKGLSREWGYVGYGYGEMQYYAADFYEWTTNAIFLNQCVKMTKARANFRRPTVDLYGGTYRAMEAISLLSWRGASESDSQFASEISYGERTLYSGGMRCAAVTVDTNLIGYAKQMLNDGQYFYWLQNVSINYESLKAFADYLKVAGAADSGVRLPMTDGQLDFAWADEDDGIVAVKRGNEKLWLSTYWQAGSGTGINGIGRFLYETNNFDRYGDLEVTPQFTSSGNYYPRPNLVDLPYKTVYQPPDNPTNAYTGEMLPQAALPPLATVPDPFVGKANFWSCRYGNFLIGINRSAINTYQLPTPSDFVSATNLITGQNMSGAITVAPQSTVVLYLNNATNSNPLPQPPLWLNAVGSSTPKIASSWTPSSGAQGYNVKRSSISGGPYTTIANVTTTNYTDTNVAVAGTYYYVVSGTNSYGESAVNSMESFASAGLPPPWNNVDVGTPNLPGNSDYANGVFTVTGNGVDIGSTSDSFQYAYTTMTNNNGSIIVRLATMQPSLAADKVGIMLRASTNTNAMAAVLMFDTSSGFNSVRFACRTGTGASMTYNWNGPYITGAPVWMQLQRSGGTNYTASFSDDGSNWTAVGTNTISSMTGTILAGTCVCARNNVFTYDTSTFDNVTLPGWPALPGIPNGLSATPGDARVVLNWTAATNATGYNVKRALFSGGAYSVVATNSPGLAYTNTGLNNGTRYYVVVSGLNVAGESANSVEASAQPVSLTPPQLAFGVSGNLIQFTWPTDHTSWRLLVQTNSLMSGLGTNWQTVPNSANTNLFAAPIDPANGTVFFRLVYP